MIVSRVMDAYSDAPVQGRSATEAILFTRKGYSGFIRFKIDTF